MEEKEIEVRPFFIKCIIIESITVFLILASVLVINFTNKSFFEKTKKWYEKNILDDTSISEVIEQGGKYEV